MQKKLKVSLWVLLSLVAIIVVMVPWAAMDAIRYRNLIVGDVDLETLTDGVHKGSSKAAGFQFH